jgi:hypothetical protein
VTTATLTRKLAPCTCCGRTDRLIGVPVRDRDGARLMLGLCDACAGSPHRTWRLRFTPEQNQ